MDDKKVADTESHDKVSAEDLAKAFDPEGKTVKKTKKTKGPKAKKWAKVLFALGMVTLIVGVSMLVVRLVSKPGVADAEFLVSTGEWIKDGSQSVIWNFTETGKGKLTTDGHLNDYDFEWSIDGNKLKIDTAWLYELNDEFNYSLDQGNKTLTLTNKDKNLEIKFKAKEV